MSSEIWGVCKKCRGRVERAHEGACPHCGAIAGYDIAINAFEDLSEGLKEGGAISKMSTYFKKNWRLLVVVIVLTIALPFLGLFLAGWPGVIVGLIGSLLTLILGFFAVTRVEERDTTRF